MSKPEQCPQCETEHDHAEADDAACSPVDLGMIADAARELERVAAIALARSGAWLRASQALLDASRRIIAECTDIERVFCGRPMGPVVAGLVCARPHGHAGACNEEGVEP